MPEITYRWYFAFIGVCLLALAGCTKKDSNTGDENKQTPSESGRPKQVSQPPTEEEVRQTIKEHLEQNSAFGKEQKVQVVSLSKPMEPSPEFLKTNPGSVSYYTTFETHTRDSTAKWNLLVVLTPMTFGPKKGKFVVNLTMNEESIKTRMGDAWLREHPVPWNVPAK
jgi:hypothetical protein